MDVIEELKSFWENSQKKNSGGGGGVGSGWGNQDGCERRIEVFVKKKMGGGVRGGGGGGGGGVRVDVNEELKFL